jgi:large subunit ribosomal protein L25
MSAIKISAEVRELSGKGPARRLRREGKLPGVVYAHGKEATSVAVVPKEFVKAMFGPLRRNTLLELDLASGPRNVMVRDIQIHPVKRHPTHVDFWEVDPNKPVTVAVPFRTKGRSKAVIAGAKLNLVKRDLRVRVLPDKIPEQVVVDITELGQGTFRAEQVEMPAGCELVEDGHLTVMTIAQPRGSAVETEEGAEPAAAPAG